MTVNTTRHIYNDVWFFANGRLCQGQIRNIQIEIDVSSKEYYSKYGIPWKITKEKYVVARYKGKSGTLMENNTITLGLNDMYNTPQEVLQLIADQYNNS